MPAIAEELVTAVVEEVSERMREPTYAQVAVGALAETHPDVGRFIAAHGDAFGGQGVLEAAFHAEVMHECFRRHLVGRTLPRVRFRDLDAVSHGEPDAKLKSTEPALALYIDSNVESEAVRRVLYLVALAFHGHARRAVASK